MGVYFPTAASLSSVYCTDGCYYTILVGLDLYKIFLDISEFCYSDELSNIFFLSFSPGLLILDDG